MINSHIVQFIIIKQKSANQIDLSEDIENKASP